MSNKKLTTGRISNEEKDYVLELHNEGKSAEQIADGLYKKFKTNRSENYIDRVISGKNTKKKAKPAAKKVSKSEASVIMIYLKKNNRVYQITPSDDNITLADIGNDFGV